MERSLEVLKVGEKKVLSLLKYAHTTRLAQQASAAVTLEYLTVIAGKTD